MLEKFVAEVFGTGTLILLGDGVVAGVLLARSKAQNAGWIAITAGWAFAVVCGVFTAQAFGAPGAVNPVGPVADMLLGKTAVAAGLAQIAGEFLGACVG